MATTDFGTDISSWLGHTPDLDPTFSTISGPRVVVESVARRWITLNGGGLFYSPAYGFDTRLLLNSRMDASQYPGIAMQLEAEALKDERVRAIAVVLSFNPTAQLLSIRGTITLATGTFAFVFQINTTTNAYSLIFPAAA